MPDIAPPALARQDRTGVPFRVMAGDGMPLGGFIWSHGESRPGRPLVVITAATAVRCRYYARFAAYLHANGFDVLTYDYRGIGESRPSSLRGLRADWADWGEKDLEALLRYAQAAFPGQPLQVVGHSIGGFAIGLAPSNGVVRRILTVGAQYAYWRDYAGDRRWRMVVKWHLVMPALTALLGYLPARRLGWMEDLPAGVVRDWSRMRARFEDTVRPGRMHDGQREGDHLALRFRQVTAPTLAIGLEDDPHGTVTAIDRLLDYFTNSHRTHWRIAPREIGQKAIGHFAFFHDRFKDSLWPVALAWLLSGQIPAWAPGHPAASAERQAESAFRSLQQTSIRY
ncbi:alpha/beta fold hydrolase [Niveispirillum fermenti]|uniref:alpha/beta hydrolase family protein n=1 Tax=Niveispirillum fermenti TaxID=1233113 RepID=UPI003A869645